MVTLQHKVSWSSGLVVCNVVFPMTRTIERDSGGFLENGVSVRSKGYSHVD